MEDGKQNIINNLYTIRAGMSYIYEQANCAEREKNKADGKINKILEEADNYNLTEEKFFNGYLNFLESGKEKAKKEKNSTIASAIFLMVLLCACIAGILYFGYSLFSCAAYQSCFSEENMSGSLTSNLGGILYFILSLVIPPAGLIAGFFIICGIRDCIGAHCIKKCKEETERLNAKIRNAGDLKNKLEIAYNERNCKPVPFVREAREVYRIFANEFIGFLDPRDWRFVDLLIFYLHTGRADNLKEALQLADKQEQTDAIVQALHEIKNTLSAKLDAINNTISACAERILANQQFMLSHEALQNALLANASVSSQKLDVTVHTVAG